MSGQIYDCPKEADEFFRQAMGKELKKASGKDHPFWNGQIQWFYDEISEQFILISKNLFSGLKQVPRWASQVALTVTEFSFRAISTLINYSKKVLSNSGIWKKSHEAAFRAWKLNEENGLLAQAYGYLFKLAYYFMEVLKQCWERALKVIGIKVTEEEKKEIFDEIDNALKCEENKPLWPRHLI